MVAASPPHRPEEGFPCTLQCVAGQRRPAHHAPWLAAEAVHVPNLGFTTGSTLAKLIFHCWIFSYFFQVHQAASSGHVLQGSPTPKTAAGHRPWHFRQPGPAVGGGVAPSPMPQRGEVGGSRISVWGKIMEPHGGSWRLKSVKYIEVHWSTELPAKWPNGSADQGHLKSYGIKWLTCRVGAMNTNS